MARTYWITRESAAKLLGISTRTIDRYIKSWKLSYKKVANKVLLAKEEIASLQEDYGALHQEISTEVVKQTELTTPKLLVQLVHLWKKLLKKKLINLCLFLMKKIKS